MTALLLVFLPLVVAYAVTIGWVVDRWNAPTQYYQHGWLLPLVAAFVIFVRRGQWSRALAAADPAAAWLLVPGLLMHLVGALLMIDSLSATSLILTVPGACWFVFGRARLRGLWPVLWLVLFAVPPPLYVEGRASFVLKEFAVSGGAGLANLLGADVSRGGSSLLLDGTQDSLFVADACGGLRSLLAMVTLGYCIAFFLGGPGWSRRSVLLLVTVPLAIGANVVRIATLCLMARWFGVGFAEGTGHTLANIAEWAVDVGGLLWLDARLSRRFDAADAVAAAPALPAPVTRGLPAPATRGLRGLSIALWLLAGPILFLTLYRPAGGGEDRAARLPDEVAGYGLIRRDAAAEARFQQSLPRWIELLGTDDFVWRRYRGAGDRNISLVALFHDANWKSVHPPRICIEGSNMEIEVDDIVPIAWLDSGSSVSRIVARSRSDGWRYLTLSLFGTVDWSSGSYTEFAGHHMPLALLRRSQSGFLLRVETPVWPDENERAAAQRCVDFLAGLVPSARELLR